MKRFSVALLALGMMSSVGLHAQQSASATFKVTARVNAVCEVTATDLSFGDYSQGLVRSSTLLRATCTPNTTYYIGLDQGQAPSATETNRYMVSGPGLLNYGLYSDSAHSIPWGNTTGTNTVTGTGTGLAQDHTVFGTIPPGQAVPAGDYADTITVRIYY
jgi:spore coat protein U-like protein